MTILPKKKHQESRKSEPDQEADSRNRTRNSRSSRETRSRGPQPGDDIHIGSVSEASGSALASPLYNDLETRDVQEGSNLPHKRSRHRQTGSSFLPANSSSHSTNRSSSKEGSASPSGEVSEDGYNSSDEHRAKTYGVQNDSVESLNEREAEFERQLSDKKGFIIKQMATDGACMFRAVADQVYGDQEMHSVVRRHCMDYMVKNRDFFSQYITEDFTSYIRRKRNEHSHGNHIEMQALSEMYNRPVEVYQYTYEPINTFHSRSYSSDENPPIRLSYHGSVHYNSVTDPYNPTVGVGLGLAGYKPEFDNQKILTQTLQDSEADLLEQEMLEDKLKATDWEATDEQLAEIAARESYLQWLKDKQQSSSSGASSSTSTSTQSRRSPPHENAATNRRTPPHEAGPTRRSPPREAKRSPPHDLYGRNGTHSGPQNKHLKGNSPRSTSHEQQPENVVQSSSRLSPSEPPQASATSNDWSFALGYAADWDNDPVLAAVLAQSQQEYLDSLCRTNTNTSEARDKSSEDTKNSDS